MLSKEIIREIINANKMVGRIETGIRYWICDFYTLSFYHPQYEHWNEFKMLLIKSQMSNCPIEKSSEELTERIDQLVNYLFKIQSL